MDSDTQRRIIENADLGNIINVSLRRQPDGLFEVYGRVNFSMFGDLTYKTISLPDTQKEHVGEVLQFCRETALSLIIETIQDLYLKNLDAVIGVNLDHVKVEKKGSGYVRIPPYIIDPLPDSPHRVIRNPQYDESKSCILNHPTPKHIPITGPYYKDTAE